MTTRLKRRKPTRSGIPKGTEPIVCRGHLQYTRGFECLGAAKEQDKCLGKIQAHHVKSRGAGGGDEQVVPLCVYHHERVHKGRQSFEVQHGMSLEAEAGTIARQSMTLQRLLRAQPSVSSNEGKE